MGKINMKMVVLGGLIAGVVINLGEYILNGVILKEDWENWAASMNQPAMDSNKMVWYILMGFVMGIAMVWLHAAIRPRFGANLRTAVIAGFFVWLTIWVIGFGSSLIEELYPTNLVLISIIWGLFEAPIATIAGTYLYKEE